MKNDIHNIFGNNIATSIESMVSYFDNWHKTPELIAEYMGDMPEIIRVGIHIAALSSGNKRLADSIYKANELIKLKRIDGFKKSVENGTHEEFLANIPWTDKDSLIVDMGLGITSEKPLTEEEHIIQASIYKDIEKEALSQGFDSVDAWRMHNSMQSMKIEPQTEVHVPHN